jgi:uncharacterized repeat protein (TIGR03809 family)
MPARYPCPLDSVARKWVALAERRRAHIVELYDTGRWRHYYTQAELVEALREAIRVRDEWARIAGLLPEGEAANTTAAKRPQRMNGR